MTQTSNSVYFQVLAPPPAEAVGWQVRVLDRSDYTTELAWVDDFIQLTVGPELCTPGSEQTHGSGSVVLDRDSPFWTRPLSNGQPASTLLDYEHLWEAWEDGDLRFQWFGTNITEGILGEDETRAVTIAGAGIAQILKRACVMPVGDPKPAGLNVPAYTDGYNPSFPVNYSAMRMWLLLLRSAQARGTITMVSPTFSELTDSAGVPFNPVSPTSDTISHPQDGIRPTVGTDLYELLNKHTGQNPDAWFTESLDWYMHPGFKLDVRRTIGTDRSASVTFHEGGVEQLERTRTREAIANYVVTVDVNGYTSPAIDSTSINRWGQREQVQNNNQNITDRTYRDSLSQVFLNQSKDEMAEWVIGVPYNEPGRRPFVDYNVGDWIGISRLDDNLVSVVETYRVLAIVIDVSDDATTVELTLQSKLQLQQLQLRRQVITILNNYNNSITPPPGSSGGNDTSGSDTTNDDENFTDPWTALPDGLRLGGTKVFIQPTDPGDEAQTGDFWLDTSAEVVPPVVSPPEPPKEDPIPSGYIRAPVVPGSKPGSVHYII